MATVTDSLVRIRVMLDTDEDIVSESLWAQHISDQLYELRSSPFEAYGLNWGDIVRCSVPQDGGLPVIEGVEKAGGRKTLRVAFLGVQCLDDQIITLDRLVAMGVTYASGGRLRPFVTVFGRLGGFRYIGI